MTTFSVQVDRRRLGTLAALGVILIAAWSWLLTGAGLGSGSMAEGMGPAQPWTVAHTVLVFVMWTAMMAAMMLPSAFPAIDRVAQRARRVAPALWFGAGYLLVWTALSLVATLLQRELDARTLLSNAMALRSRQSASIVLVAIGLYQFAPVKQACLTRCRALTALVPRDGPVSSESMLREGLRYGAYCAGCCALVMGVLLVVGVMNAAWIAALTVWALAEKTLPGGGDLARIAGLGLIGWGTMALAPPLL
jgi:predicted metal-binding membrane protein